MGHLVRDWRRTGEQPPAHLLLPRTAPSGTFREALQRLTMRQAVSAIQMPIDVGLGGILLANMLVAWLDGDPKVLPTGEAVDESQDRRTSGARRAGLPVERGVADFFECRPVHRFLVHHRVPTGLSLRWTSRSRGAEIIRQYCSS